MLNFVRMVCANDSHSAYNWHGFSYVEPCVCMWAGTRKRSENVLLLICMMGACHYYSFNYKPDNHTDTVSILLRRYLNTLFEVRCHCFHCLCLQLLEAWCLG